MRNRRREYLGRLRPARVKEQHPSKEARPGQTGRGGMGRRVVTHAGLEAAPGEASLGLRSPKHFVELCVLPPLSLPIISEVEAAQKR